MSCKITLKTPFLVIEAIENVAKQLNVYKETRDGNIYLNSLLKENHKYATSDERFNELYPSKKGVSK